MEYTEQDLAAVGKIQEAKNVTPAKAKEIFRKHVLKLSNQDAADRADLVLAAIERGVEVNGDEEAPAAKPNGKPTRNERRLAKKERQAEKKAAKKGKAAKAAKKSDGTPRVECELAELTREVELTATETTGVYTATLFGRKAVAVWAERNRSAAAKRLETVNVSEARVDKAKKYGKDNDVAVAICLTVKVNGKLDQGYAVPLATFDKFKTAGNGMALSGAARKAYAEDGWAGVKFVERKVDEKAA